ncbi:MAG: glutathione S-transferase family protein [bacterium]|nr:glutathione S-transferase family protein [bacterium]
MKSSPIKLYQFWFSHFNEKARWILDYKGLEYETVTFAPGMHFKGMRAATGQTSTPVAQIGSEKNNNNEFVVGSGAIGERVDVLGSGPALLPEDAKRRQAVLEDCTWFDRKIGGLHRRSLFHFLFEHDRGSVAALFGIAQPFARRWFYTLSMPMLCPVLRKMDQINAETAAQGEANIEAALARVAQADAGSGYLHGDAFSLADLTAAALLFPVALPPELSFKIPPRARPALEAWRDRWRDYAGIEWVLRMFREHRGRR